MHNIERHKEKARVAFDRQAETYDASYKGFIGRYQRRSYGYVIEALSALEFSSLLDVGCGTGALLEQIKSKWPDTRISGVDISGEMVKVASQRLGRTTEVVVGDAENLPWEDNSFDAVVSTISFHHYPHPITALTEIRRVLKPGGHLLLSDLTAPAPLRQIFNLLLPLSPEGDVKLYSKSEILEFLNDAGFKEARLRVSGRWIYLVVAFAAKNECLKQ